MSFMEKTKGDIADCVKKQSAMSPFPPALSTASLSITAVYNGTTNYATSTSSTLTQTVNQDGSSTTLSSSANPSIISTAVTYSQLSETKCSCILES
jgi:hypothetical protein